MVGDYALQRSRKCHTLQNVITKRLRPSCKTASATSLWTPITRPRTPSTAWCSRSLICWRVTTAYLSATDLNALAHLAPTSALAHDRQTPHPRRSGRGYAAIPLPVLPSRALHSASQANTRTARRRKSIKRNVEISEQRNHDMRPQSRDDLPAVEPMRRHINRIDATKYQKDSRRPRP